MWKDPIIEEIHKIRDEHAARFNYDPVAIYNDLKRLERESGRETVMFAPRRLSDLEVRSEGKRDGTHCLSISC
ncbi:MAG: hypothetical protein BECKG1743D_GA0114223_107463 [Candidatus Kentron sp. G]|nr:MAG: hypothetical protein BECKG1743F_GA0114225_107193 [Candidatus Kentron sp. G]VFN05628.1 MAG: hypothetical protein BECKG1743D_GA0114223_107463 [Candidatus Kentron sp. G]VFN06867.1 MAG: hypothetical protein BECKG1743E_GA0114224_110811 [Candidatus Kentron sp. G]